MKWYIRKVLTADALSRLENHGELLSLSVSTVTTELYDRIFRSWESDAQVQEIVGQLQNGKPAKKHYTWVNGQLLRKNRLVVGNDKQLRVELLKHIHEGVIGGHSGIQPTTQKVISLFYWKGLIREVKNLVRECLICQKNKPDLASYPGLLQPLPIP